MGIDLGVDNLYTCTINDDLTPIIFSGKPLKSIIQFYAKRIGKYQSKLKIKQFNSRRLSILWNRRYYRIEDYLHKVSRRIVDLAKLEDIHTIIIGKNANWKQKSNLNKKINQMFQQIPFSKLIDLIIYKAELLGINVIVYNESYTSGTSFLDHEIPNKQNYNKSRRITRGLFKATNGKLINSDINGSLQIIHKVFYETINNILANSYSEQIYDQLIYNEIFDFNHFVLFNNIKIKNLDIIVTPV